MPSLFNLKNNANDKSNSNQNMIRESGAGFTMVEILIAVAILAVILSLGLFVSFDFYKSYAFGAEKQVIVSILQKARGQSLNNINQKTHGVHFQANPLQYILFECSGCASYTADISDQIIDSSYGISITQPAILPSGFDVIFQQLSGASLDQTITVSNGVTSYDISINSEGQISW